MVVADDTKEKSSNIVTICRYMYRQKLGLLFYGCAQLINECREYTLGVINTISAARGLYMYLFLCCSPRLYMVCWMSMLLTPCQTKSMMPR